LLLLSLSAGVPRAIEVVPDLIPIPNALLFEISALFNLNFSFYNGE
jgi:hypothetical protein